MRDGSESGNHPQTRRRRGRPRNQPDTQSTTPVQALDRGIQILKLLSSGGAATLSDIAMQAGMPASTTHRSLMTLNAHQLVQFEETTQVWSIGLEAFRIGSAFLRQTNLAEAARQPLRGLAEESAETANLGIMNDNSVVFVSQVESHSPIRAFFRPGTRSRMHVSGIGKAILAALPEAEIKKVLQKTGLKEYTANTLTTPEKLFEDLELTRARGWALDDEEHYPGMRCVAAPIFDTGSTVIAGISVSGPTIRFQQSRIAILGDAVRRAANDITLALGAAYPENLSDRSR